MNTRRAAPRATFVTTMYAGMPAGATLGGLSAIWLIPHFGWQSLFILGGGIPIMIALAVAISSLSRSNFCGTRKRQRRIRRIVSKISPALARDEEVRFCSSEKKLPGVPVKRLFTQGRSLMTVLLWAGLIRGPLHALDTRFVVTYAAEEERCLGPAVQPGLRIPLFRRGRGDNLHRPPDGQGQPLPGAASRLCFWRLEPRGLWLYAGRSVSPHRRFVRCVRILYQRQQRRPPGGHDDFLSLDIRGSGIGWAYAVAKIGAMAAPAMGGFILSRSWGVSRICCTNALVGFGCRGNYPGPAGYVAATARRSEEVAARAVPAGEAA